MRGEINEVMLVTGELFTSGICVRAGLTLPSFTSKSACAIDVLADVCAITDPMMRGVAGGAPVAAGLI
jgi:hypothetical protein